MALSFQLSDKMTTFLTSSDAGVTNTDVSSLSTTAAPWEFVSGSLVVPEEIIFSVPDAAGQR